MLSPCHNSFLDSSNSFPNDVDASSPPSNNAISPSSQDQQLLVDRLLSTTNPDISQPSGALFHPVVQTGQTPISRAVYSTSCTANTINDRPRNEFILRACSRSLSSQQRSFPSQHGRVYPSRHSLPISRTVAAEAESSSSRPLSIAPRVQNQQESPPISAGSQLATPALLYPPMIRPRPKPAGFVSIPATAQARRDLVKVMSAENVSEARETGEHIQRSIDCWMEDAKTVLIFNSVFVPTVASFIIDSYKLLSPEIGHQSSQNLSPPPTASIIIVNAMWLMSLVLNITSTLSATSTLMLQTQSPEDPRTQRDHMHSRSCLFICTLSVFLFLAGLVIFFFTIHKIVGIVVLIVLIVAGLFEVVCLALLPVSTAPAPNPPIVLHGRYGAAVRRGYT